MNWIHRLVYQVRLGELLKSSELSDIVTIKIPIGKTDINRYPLLALNDLKTTYHNFIEESTMKHLDEKLIIIVEAVN